MSITSDYHLHSSFSGDSNTPMEDMVKEGIERGLTHMCFTEHMDMDFPASLHNPENIFLLNTDSYLYDFIRNQEKYTSRIHLMFGVELGLQPHLAQKHEEYVKQYDFDFIIGSSHICRGQDPYYPSFYEDKSEEEAYRLYFTSILENIHAFSDFDVYGHLDYIIRYSPYKDLHYSYEKYKDILDTILQTLIEKGKGIEINTGGAEAGLKELHPCNAIIKRYHELGGEIITVGSDAHVPGHVANHFKRAAQVLLDAGFHYYTVFEKRKPQFLRLIT